MVDCMAEVTELITKFSFAGSTSPLTNFNGALGNSIGLLAGATAAVAVASAAFSKWASGVLQAEQPLINLSTQTGVAVEAIEELGFAASVSNSSAGALNSTLSGLSGKIGDAAQKGSEDFSRLGISVRKANGEIKASDEVLLEVGERFQQMGLSMSEQQSFAEALGIDPSLITLMTKSSGAIKGLREEAREMGILTGEQTAQALEYNNALTTMNFSMDSVRRLVAVGLAPEMTALAGKFQTLVTENKDWIINGIQATVAGVGNLFDALVRLAPFMGVVALAFVAAKVATLGWAGALALAFSPVILITAGIVAALFVIDDLIVAFQGGKSVIGDFFQEFFGFDIQPVLQDIVTGFTEAFAVLIDIGKGFISSLGSLFSGISNLLSGNFEQAWVDIEASFSILLETLGMAFQNVFGGVFDWIKDAILSILPDWALKLIGADTPDASESAPASTGIDQSFRPGGGRAASTQSSNVSQEVAINIRTSDPERAGRAAADSLQRQMTDAQTQSKRGGM